MEFPNSSQSMIMSERFVSSFDSNDVKCAVNYLIDDNKKNYFIFFMSYQSQLFIFLVLY